jgi:hypothetical protein
MAFRITKASPSNPPWDGKRIQPQSGSKDRNMFSTPIGDGGVTKVDFKARERAHKQISEWLDLEKQRRWAFATKGTWLDGGKR